MIKSGESVQTPVSDRPLDEPLLDAWFELNYRLQEEAIDTQINKTFIEQWMKRLWTIVSPRPQCFWLFLARLNELALLCASRYVDCCDFAAADQFLVEPCSVFLHDEGGWTLSGTGYRCPVAVLGHSAVSKGRGSLPGWGRQCVLSYEKAGPLLPSLYGLLKGSGYMTEEYLVSVSRRIEKIAQVAGMLVGLGMDKTEDISRVLSWMDEDQRKEFRSRLCVFDRKIFNDIGRALHLFMFYGHVDGKYAGKYLCR